MPADHALLQQALQQPVSALQRLELMLFVRETAQLHGQPQQLFKQKPPTSSAQENDWSLLCQLCHKLCDWPGLIQLLAASGDSGDMALCALAHLRMGQWYEAEQQLQRLRIAKPNIETSHLEVAATVSNLLLHSFCLHSDQGLLLRPLQAFDLSDFCWQYSTDIAERCNLPDFESDRHWHHWLSESQADPRQWVFAIIHPAFGFIGSVALEIHNDNGFFYYWIGADFQGQGFGPDAARSAMHWAADTQGVQHWFAKVYDHNWPSLKAIQQLGFQPMACSLACPFDNEVLFSLSDITCQVGLFDRLQQLMVDMDCDYQLVPWAGAFIR
ncbi:hypothetical protein CHH28_14630 [Bacterioplanes sanyensis]|uniref:N-acetyltransferase domain-containing protein n=1 Tax=Bacterioplanes sanyensis TaxID=1249553 RepID=A0A222FMD3_9GAMM|nr:GNAT family N-acetyltransferase [Bacterioplanes sanyensis]ASP39832.1 hypothetical protein CHH28_14630 [Bacterioplanes sanyensis]